MKYEIPEMKIYKVELTNIVTVSEGTDKPSGEWTKPYSLLDKEKEIL